MSTLTIRGTGEQVPIGKILCLGKNYEKHAREMGGSVPTTPVVFMKAPSAYVGDGGTVLRPRISNDMHHEVELVVVMGSTCRDVAEEDAMSHVLGYAVGLDMTLRDVQAAAKKRGEPWTVAKAFDTSAPISLVASRMTVPDPHDLSLALRVNGDFRQHASTGEMIMKIPAIIAYLSAIFTLERGDCIFTGTPEGVGPVVAGDRLHAALEGVVDLKVTIADR